MTEKENLNEIYDIGGYFELEFPAEQEYHNDALRFNSGRNALCFYMLKNGLRKLFVPYYICDTVIDALRKSGVDIHFYSIDENFSPMVTPEEVRSVPILCVNYFGIGNRVIKQCIEKYENVICDFSQAFFSKPESRTPTFYSPRKFLGVADGGYLYAEGLSNDNVYRDDSAQRYTSLLVRLESGAEAGYFLYNNTEQLLSRTKIRRMSLLTQKVLSSVRYDDIWEKRENNFNYLNRFLKNANLLNIQKQSVHGPMVYPFLTNNPGLRPYLEKNKIIIQQYWPEVLTRVNEDSFEYRLVKNMCALPIDQRYGSKEMDRLLELVQSYFEEHSLPNKELNNPSPIEI